MKHSSFVVHSTPSDKGGSRGREQEMGFFRRLSKSNVPPKQSRSQRHIEELLREEERINVEQAKTANALEALGNAEIIHDIGDRLTKHEDTENGWRTPASHINHPEVSCNDLARPVANMLGKVASYRSPKQRVPAELVDPLPSSDELKTRHVQLSATSQCIQELKDILDIWEESAYKNIPDSEPELAGLYICCEWIILLKLRYFYCDMMATIVLWNGEVEISEVHRQNAQEMARCLTVDRHLFEEAVQSLIDWRPDQFSALGYTREMWDVLGLPEFSS
jgi:hypothetical protein